MWNWIHTKYFLMANPGREGNVISGETVKTQLHLYCSFIFIQVYRKYERIWVFPFCWWINGYLLINILFFSMKKCLHSRSLVSATGFSDLEYLRDFERQHIYKQNSLHGEGTQSVSHQKQVRRQRRENINVN